MGTGFTGIGSNEAAEQLANNALSNSCDGPESYCGLSDCLRTQIKYGHTKCRKHGGASMTLQPNKTEVNSKLTRAIMNLKRGVMKTKTEIILTGYNNKIHLVHLKLTIESKYIIRPLDIYFRKLSQSKTSRYCELGCSNFAHKFVFR